MPSDETGGPPDVVSRRGALGRVAECVGAIVTAAAAEQASAAVERAAEPEGWYARRSSCVSGNRLVGAASDAALAPRTLAREIYLPRSAGEIAEVVRALPAGTPVASVCGGHESSNAATLASREAVILDLARLDGIDFQEEGGEALVTVGAGVVFKPLVEAVRARQGALPVGTGPDVGVVGYLVNGGLSGYFSRRLGLLGQRVTRMTVVTAAGEIRVLTPDDELFTAMLGAGSALAIVVDVTLRLAPERVVRGAEQRVIAFTTRDEAVAFAREALRFQRDTVLPDESVSMELVVAGTKVLVVTVVCYDSFPGSPAAFVKPLEDLAARHGLAVVASSHLGSWYETAAALWPVIEGMKGSPLAMLQHSVGTVDAPGDAILDFVCDGVIAGAPLDEAPLSIVEIRTLGAAIAAGRALPTGNCHHRFFCDLIVLYDAQGTSAAGRGAIAEGAARVMAEARRVEGLSIDSSGTHSQPDDPVGAPAPAEIFGTAAMAGMIARLKAQVDPGNRFRFHPYAKFL